jgi:hypothetical protein
MVHQIIERKQNHMVRHVNPQLITRKQNHMVPHVIPQLITRKQHHMVHMTYVNAPWPNYGILPPIYPIKQLPK